MIGNKIMKKKLLAALMILSASTLYANAESGITLGIQGGYAKFIPFSKINGDINNGGIYGGGQLGYDYAFNPYFSLGLETGINYGKNIAKFSSSTERINIDVLNVPILATFKFYIPQTNGLNIFTKHGIAFVYQTRDISYPHRPYQTDSENTMKFNIFASTVGIGWKIKNFNIFTQYEYFYGTNWNKLDKSIKILTLNALTLGVSYTIPV